jgi:iron complex outermembrane receptor protein
MTPMSAFRLRFCCSFRLRACCVAASISSLVGVHPLLAQTAAPPPAAATPPGEEELVRLSEFRVDSSQDVGYRATNTISGTRLNTAIKDVPMPIEVITEEFIRDINAVDFRESLRYSAGILLSSKQDALEGESTLQDPTDSKIKLRGFVTNEQLRNGFQRAHPGDTVNISRVEVVRGPSAILYGIGSFGGIVNFIGKRPSDRPRSEFHAHVGNHDYRRVDLDLTGPFELGPLNAGYRLMAAYTERGHWTDFFTRETRYVAPVVELRPFRDTTITLDGEWSQERRQGIGFRQIWGASDRNVNNRLGSDWLPSPNHRTFRWSGPDTFQDSDNYSLIAELDQRIGDHLGLLVGFMAAEADFSSRSLIEPAIVGNQGPVELRQNFSWFSLNFGQITVNNATLRARWEESQSRRPRYQTRVEANYRIDLGRYLGEHSFLLGRTDSKRQNHLQIARTTWNFRRWDDYSYYRFADNPHPLVPDFNDTTRFYDQGHYLVHQGKFFNGRIHTVSGVRHDRSDTWRTVRNPATGAITSQLRRPSGEPATEVTVQLGATFKINEQLSLYVLRGGGLQPNYTQLNGLGEPFDPVTAKSHEIGLKFDLLEGRVSGTMSAFKVDRQNATRNIWWAPAPGLQGPGGAVYDPNKPIVYAAFPHTALLASYFSWANQGQLTLLRWDDPADRAKIYEYVNATRDPNHPLYRTTTPRFLFRSEEGFPAGANFPSINRGAHVAVDDTSEGFDAQIFITHGRHWQTVLTYAYVDRWLTHDARLVKYPHPHPDFELWYQNFYAHQDNNFAVLPAPGQLEVGDTSSYKGDAALVGARLDDTPYHQGSIWNRFDFGNEGALAGVNVALGFRYTGPREVQGLAGPDGSGVNQRAAVGPIMSPEEINFDLALGYARQLGGRPWRFQLNVDNLLDRQKRIADISGFPNQDNVGQGIVYQDPRQIRFTVGVEF